MKTKTAKTKPESRRREHLEEEDIDGYPVYPSTEDIYGNFDKVDDEDPDVPASVRRRTSHKIVERFLSEDDPENGLDVPGSELDDDMEIIGDEDEENNYYSLGGDGHNNLEEDNLD